MSANLRIVDTESKVVNWKRVDFLCKKIIAHGMIVTTVIAVSWTVYKVLSWAFGGI